MVEKLVLDAFLKNQNNLLDQQSKVLHSLLLLYVQVEGYGNILKLGCRPLGFTTFNPASFSAWTL